MNPTDLIYSPIGTTKFFDSNGNAIILIQDAPVEIEGVEELTKDEFGVENIVVVKKSSYTKAHLEAQRKYREKYPEKYCELQKKVYDKNKEDPTWWEHFKERSKVNNRIHREKKKQELINQGVVVRGRGRPKKVQNL
jgi:hypothetical protein